MEPHALKKFFHFSDADLLANRNGRLSENQQKRIEAESRLERKSARESAAILLVFASLGLGAGLLIAFNAPTWTGRILIGSLLCVLWPLAWGWRAWGAWRSAPPPTRQEQVRAAKGRVRIVRYEDEYVLEVDGRQFDLEKNPSAVLADGDETVVFYLERTEEILSLDAL